MMDSNQRMIDTQARKITELNAQVRNLTEQNFRLKDDRKLADAYRELQQQIASSPILQSEWERFLVILKMAGDEDYVKRAEAQARDSWGGRTKA